MTVDDVPEDMTVRVSDLKKVGYCARGARRWFEARGFDFRDFLANGIAARTLVETGDALALRVVRLKIEREQADG